MKNKTSLLIPEFFASPLCIEETNGALTKIYLCELDPKNPRPKNRESSSPILIEAVDQILAYFKGNLTHFDLPYKLEGPLGNPKAVRAVGSANRLNPLPILIPCHRVTKKDQDTARVFSLGGVPSQIKLLALEKNGAI